MALTREFIEAVTQGNLLRVRIMLKDSLLVDTSFEQFKEMLDFVEPKLKDLWMSNEDDEELSQSTDELNNILVGLVNNFSKKRVTHLMGLINKAYPPKPKRATNGNMYRENTVIIKKTRSVVNEYHSILEEKKKMSKVCAKIGSKKPMDISDIAAIRKAAMNIIEHCDKISGK